MSWGQGASKVEDLIEAGAITRLQGADLGVSGLMDRVRQQLGSAETLLDPDPATAYVVAYDAAKHAAMALLAEQNLRVTSDGGHVAMEKVLAAQFGGVFDGFGRLRRRRNELDYPASAEDFADAAETQRALASARGIVESAQQILDQGILTTF